VLVGLFVAAGIGLNPVLPVGAGAAFVGCGEYMPFWFRDEVELPTFSATGMLRNEFPLFVNDAVLCGAGGPGTGGGVGAIRDTRGIVFMLELDPGTRFCTSSTSFIKPDIPSISRSEATL
jgi:hypothetical protein